MPVDAAWPPVIVVAEAPDPVRYYRLEKPIVGIGVRASGKTLARITDDLPRAALGFDAHLVGRFGIGRGRTFGLWPEIGYVHSGANGRFLGIALGYASQTPTIGTTFGSGLSLGLVPRALIGVREHASAWGVRTSALAEIYLDDGNAWGVELCHQFVNYNGRTVHEIAGGISLTLMGHRW